MKNTILFFSLVFILVLTSCGPAAESRETMMSRSKQVQDSIANSIKSAIDEVSATPNAIVVPAPADTTHKKPQ